MGDQIQGMETSPEQGLPAQEQNPEVQKEATPKLPENLEEAYLNLEKRLRDKDSFISKQYEEIQKTRNLEIELAELRKQISNKSTFTKEEAEVFVKAKQKEEELNSYNLSLEQERNRQVLSQQVPDLDALKEGIIQELKNQKIPQAEIDAFAANPYAFHASTVVPYADIARIRMENKRLKQGTDYVMDNIEKAANTKPITNSMGMQTRTQSTELGLEDYMKWSLEDIKKEREKLRSQRGY